MLFVQQILSEDLHPNSYFYENLCISSETPGTILLVYMPTSLLSLLMCPSRQLLPSSFAPSLMVRYFKSPFKEIHFI